MAKQNFSNEQWRDSLSKNECPYGCIVKTKMCRHLTEMLPSEDAGAVHWQSSQQKPQRIIYTDDIEKYAEAIVDPQMDASSAEEFIEGLAEKGLHPEEIEVVSDKILLNMSFKDIAEERGYPNTMTAFRAFSRALKKIKKGMK